MDFLLVDPDRASDPDYIEAWWAEWFRVEDEYALVQVPMPPVPANAPRWPTPEPEPEPEPEPIPEPVPTPVVQAPPANGMDEAQLRVTAHREGPALVMAGAGSGKTRTITSRVASLARREEVKSLLCLTFTRKAASEMRHRIANEIGSDSAKHLTISTFHSLALDLIRANPAACGRQVGFSVWDDDIQKHEIKAIIKQHDLANKVKGGEWVPTKKVCKALDTVKETCQPLGGKAFHRILSDVHEQAWEVAVAYEELKKACNALDFADLVWLVATQLLDPKNPACASIQSRWSWIIVDEYQDTNAVQELLLDRLSERHRNLMVVGDEDQSIYAFRGSNVDYIRTFPTRYPGAVTYLLGRNYRSTPEIVSSANALISHNKKRNFKTVWSEGVNGTPIAINAWTDPREEARATAYAIEDQRNTGTPDTEIAVLVRTRSQFMLLQMELQKRAVPFHVVGDSPWYTRVDAKIILSWLRGVVNPRDLSAGATVLSSWDGLGNGTVTTWRESIQSVVAPMFARLEFLHQKPGLGAHTKRGGRLAAFGRAWEEWSNDTLRPGGTASLRDRVEGLLRLLGITGEIIVGEASGNPAEVEEALRRKAFLVQLVESMPNEPGTGRHDGITAWLDALFTALQNDQRRDGICLSTIHGSKGLEWDYVWLPGWSSDVFPSERSQSSSAIEEERRLAYVALTRARRGASVSWFRTSSIPEPRTHSASIFLAEMDPARAKDAAWTQQEVQEVPEPTERTYVPEVQPEWTRPEWFVQAVGELGHAIPDDDQSEFAWDAWDSPITAVVLREVTLHDEEEPSRCTACQRAIRVAVALTVYSSDPEFPPNIRLGRRCAARILGHRGFLFDATVAYDAIRASTVGFNERNQVPEHAPHARPSRIIDMSPTPVPTAPSPAGPRFIDMSPATTPPKTTSTSLDPGPSKCYPAPVHSRSSTPKPRA